jgi:hypothetical protein
MALSKVTVLSLATVAFFFKAQRLIDLLGMDLSQRAGLSGLGEFTVVLAEVAIEHGLGLGKCFGFGQSQFTD